jgi:hypothetical protein
LHFLKKSAAKIGQGFKKVRQKALFRKKCGKNQAGFRKKRTKNRAEFKKKRTKNRAGFKKSALQNKKIEYHIVMNNHYIHYGSIIILRIHGREKEWNHVIMDRKRLCNPMASHGSRIR